MSLTGWWKGRRGEWYVVAQLVLLVRVFFGPRTWRGWSPWVFPYNLLASIGGGVLFMVGSLLLAAAIFRLGPNFTAVPCPKEEGELVQTGPYKLVRHPMYCGGVFLAFGWAFLVHGWLTIGYAIILLLFFDIKSRREEEWLKGKFSEYGSYQQRVRKLIPFIY